MRKIQTTKHFRQLIRSNQRIVLFQGGSRSGKTFNILIALVTMALQERLVVDIVRRTLPALKATVLRDLFDVFDLFGITPAHNKTDRILYVGDSEFCYYSLDEEEKIRGRKRDIAFINELTEIPEDVVKQILLRTSLKVVADYNPSITEDHYIVSLQKREDSVTFRSTFLDNSFLPISIREEILALKDTDEWMWRVFGLGEIATPKDIIFQYKLAEEPRGKFLGYGLDFGFSVDPTALIGVWEDGRNLYLKELLYETHLTTQDIAERLYSLGVTSNIIADNSEPRLIAELSGMGIRIRPVAQKDKRILPGINAMRTYNLFVLPDSPNLRMELSLYKWKGSVPLDRFNHLLDSARYVVMSGGKGKYTWR